MRLVSKLIQKWLEKRSRKGKGLQFYGGKGVGGMKVSTRAKLCLYDLNFPLTPKDGIIKFSFQLSQMCC